MLAETVREASRLKCWEDHADLAASLSQIPLAEGDQVLAIDDDLPSVGRPAG